MSNRRRPGPLATNNAYLYSDLNVCVRCGAKTSTLSKICSACLNRDYIARQLDHIKERLAREPATLIELARDLRGIPHLVLLSTGRLAWCGALVTESPLKRRREKGANMPAALCPACRKSLRIFLPDAAE